MPKRKRRSKGWTYTAGSYPHSVRVYERGGPGGVISAATYDGRLRNGEGGEHRVSLGHRDRDKAMAYAEEQARRLREDSSVAAKPTVATVFGLYRKNRTPDKGHWQQAADRQAARRWEKHLGIDFDLSQLSRREWDSFERARRRGEFGGRKVGNRTVQKDQVWLRSVCRWATEWREGGDYLLDRDPTRGFPVARERNPSRPIASDDRVEAIRKKYRRVNMRLERGGNRETVESFLPEVFEIVVGTGRRISAVRGLRAEDIRLDRTPSEPYGAIVFRADTDKMDKEWRCPVTERVRDALASAMRKRQAVGPGPLFPKPSDPTKPVGYAEVTAWLRKAEELAGLERQKDGAWHPYRRRWATVRKGLEDADAMRAGGWSSLAAFKVYQQPDPEATLRVVLHEAKLREAK